MLRDSPEPIRPTVPSMTLNVVTPEQLAALTDEIVERVAALKTTWLPQVPLDLDEMAAFFHVSPQTIRRWTNEGALGSWKHDNTVLYMPSHVSAFVERGQR